MSASGHSSRGYARHRGGGNHGCGDGGEPTPPDEPGFAWTQASAYDRRREIYGHCLLRLHCPEAARRESRMCGVSQNAYAAGKTTTIRILLGLLRGDGGNQKRRRELIEAFDLDPAKKARAYSKGNRQKVALIAALAGDAELLLLDEPTAGLDPLMEAVFRALHDAVVSGDRLRCAVDNASLNEVLRRLTMTAVRSLTCRPPTLEELARAPT